MVRKTKAETEKTFHALLDAAAELFTRRGVARTTLHEIARHAGMTRGAIYWHFENKDAVIRALWERDAQQTHLQCVDNMVQSLHSDAVLDFRNTLKTSLNSLMGDPRAARSMRIVFHNVEYTDESSDLQEFLHEQHSQLLQVLVQVFQVLAERKQLKTSLTPQLIATGLLAFMRGLLDFHLAPHGVVVDLVSDGEAYIDFYLDSVLVDSI